MKSKLCIIPFLLSFTLMCSCSYYPPHQKDWHITTFELADKYFPKYFDTIENFFIEYEITFEKECYEQVIDSKKKYENIYYFSDLMSLDCIFNYRGDAHLGSYFILTFNYKSNNLNEILSFSQNYINVFSDIINFCSYEFYESNIDSKTFYEKSYDLMKKRMKIMNFQKIYHFVINMFLQ